jgi:hypothetical protein
LKAFFLPQPEARYASRTALAVRDAEWVLAFCEAPSNDEAKAKLAVELCSVATDLFCNNKEQEHRYRGERTRSAAECVLPILLKSLLLTQQSELVIRVFNHVRNFPKLFTHENGQVPALCELVPWCQKQFGEVPNAIRDWLKAVRAELSASTKSRPKPPTDWTRPATLTCSCASCAEVKKFLLDPTLESHQIRGNEDQRNHLEQQTQRDQLDVKCSLNKATRPFGLVMTKTLASHTRAEHQYEVDCKLLAELPVETG